MGLDATRVDGEPGSGEVQGPAKHAVDMDGARDEPAPECAEVLGFSVNAVDMDGTVGRCLELMERNHRPVRQVSLNAAKLVHARDNPGMAEFIRASDIVSADGQGLVWAAGILGQPVPERVAGIDLMERLLAASTERSYDVFLLGARPEVLERAAAELKRRHRGLRIVGTRDGYFHASEEAAVAEEIRRSKADLLFVAMSSPRKEEFLARQLDATGVRFAMGVGGALDVVAGASARAPEWMQRAGLEWAFRLALEPRRLWRRYLLGNLRFTWIVAKAVIARRAASGDGSRVPG